MRLSAYDFTNAVSRALRLAYCLHPDLYVARRVVLEAVLFLNQQVRRYKRPPTTRPYLRAYPLEAEASTLMEELFQLSIFDVSERWERDQESPQPQLEPKYRPTVPVLLTRFVKQLVFSTIERADSYPMAVAVGSCLFTCTPVEACEVASLIASKRLANVDRVKRQILRRCTRRFRHMWRDHEMPTRVLPLTEPDGKATATAEWQVVQQAMGVFTPWTTQCFQEPPAVWEQLPEDVDPDPEEESQAPQHEQHDEEWSERRRMHALLCPTCAGFPKLATLWEKPLTLSIPVFPIKTLTNTDDHFKPPVPPGFLNDLRISITNIVQEVEQRRKGRPFEVLRVCADYEEVGRWGDAVQTTQTFRIPADTLRVHVFGQDDRGEVPLGVFYMPDLEDDPASEPLYHVLESGPTLVLTVSPTETADAMQIQLAFWPEEAAVPKTAAWYAAAVATAARGLELAQITGDAARETDLRQRLRSLHHSMSAVSAQGGELAALAEGLGQWLAELAERVTQWVSALWTPQWAGVTVSAADIPPQVHAFVMDPGTITVTCHWGEDARARPFIFLEWQANFPVVADIWVQFRQPDTEALLAEYSLGTALSGTRTFTQARLGFDPVRERWGLAVMLKETSA